VQGAAGAIIPRAGYLTAVRKICDQARILLIADEVQTKLGRTGRRFGCGHESVTPDEYVLGKALGGRILPLSAVVANDHVLDKRIDHAVAAMSAPLGGESVGTRGDHACDPNPDATGTAGGTHHRYRS
jgi:adenosylmethionine-8-amino-7-oxononanoate aminotransferase